MVRVGADDVLVVQEDAADVAKDDHPAGEAVVITDVHGAGRGGAGEDWDRFEAGAGDVETADDPVRLYMREIGRVGLLTAAEERTLASEIELVSHLEQLERELARGLGDDCGEDAGADGAPAAAPWERAMLLLARVARAGPVARTVARHLELGDAPTLEDVCEHPRFRAAIDGVISPELVERAARDLGITEEDAPRAHREVVPGHAGAAAGGDHRRCLPRAGVDGAASRKLRGLGPVHPDPAVPNAGGSGAEPTGGGSG